MHELENTATKARGIHCAGSDDTYLREELLKRCESLEREMSKAVEVLQRRQKTDVSLAKTYDNGMPDQRFYLNVHSLLNSLFEPRPWEKGFSRTPRSIYNHCSECLRLTRS